MTTNLGTTTQAQAKTGTVRLHRVLRAPPERVYKAFLDAQALEKWLPPRGFTGRVHDKVEPRVGGGYRMSFTNFGAGASHSFRVTFVELTPYSRIRHVDRFDDPNMAGEMTVTIDLKPVLAGTEVSIVQEGIPAQIPLEFCVLGWQESLDQLIDLVEPDIPAEPGAA